MTKDLRTADLIVKLVLSISTIVLFLFEIIAGPVAAMLVVLSVLVIATYAIRFFTVKHP